MNIETTRLSSKGQVVIPKSIINAHKWGKGLEFHVLDTEQGVVFTPCLPFKRTTVSEVRGCLQYTGKPKTLKEMEEGIAKGARNSR